MPRLIVGAPLLFVFEPFVNSSIRVRQDCRRTCRIGLLLPNGQPNFVLAGNTEGIRIQSFKIGGIEQLAVVGGLPLSVFAAFVLSGALIFDVVQQVARVEIELVRSLESPVPNPPIALAFVPVTFEGSL
jgi:hypothetical protein